MTDSGYSSSIFSSPDIATLVANFPPLQISESGRPVVVRSYTGNNLKSSNDIIAHFKDLVEKSDHRIPKGDLASVLGIERDAENLVLDQLHPQLYYSRDGRQIIPHPIIEATAAQLKAYALRTVVDLRAFALDHDIASISLDRMIEVYSGKDWPRVIVDVDDRSFLCSHDYSESLKTHIQNAISDAGHDMCDLSSVVGEDVPSAIVTALATEIVNGEGGDVKLAGDHVMYVPKGHEKVMAERMQQVLDERIAAMVKLVELEGYCVVEEGAGSVSTSTRSLDEAVVAVYEKQYPGSSPLEVLDLTRCGIKAGKALKSTSTEKVIVNLRTLHDELDALKLAIAARTEILWQADPASAKPADIPRLLETSDFTSPHKDDLATFLVRSGVHAKILEAASQQKLSELQGEVSEEFTDLIETRLWCPLHLYAAGIIAAQDPTLKVNLETFVTNYFKQDVIPATVAAAREQNLLNHRARIRETNKLKDSVDEARTFDDLQKAVSRFGKKLRITPPSEDLVAQTKTTTINATLKSLSRMTRGSDILQNLIWILLATSGPGLFVSGGKDTSRMIRFYDGIGDTEVAGMLNIWRDKLKSGTDDEEDRRQMKELAKAAVEEWSEEQRVRPYSGT